MQKKMLVKRTPYPRVYEQAVGARISSCDSFDAEPRNVRLDEVITLYNQLHPKLQKLVIEQLKVLLEMSKPFGKGKEYQ